MPLTLRELLDDPGLGLKLVAGHEGVHERGPVRWAHSSDTPDPTPWLAGGELLLTTGLGVRDDPAAQRRLVRSLADRGCVGIGFGVGVAVADVPPAMLGEADACRLPLFTVPFEVPFIAVTRRVARAVFDEHYATLASAVDLHRQVLQTVITGQGIDAVLTTTASRMPAASFLTYDFAGTVLACHAAVDAPSVDAQAVWKVLAPAHADRDRVVLPLDGRTVTGAVVRVGDEVEAVLAVVTPDPPQDHESLLIEQGLAGVSLELARGQSVREAHRARVDELLDEAMAGRAGRVVASRVLSRLGWPCDRAYRVLCLAPPTTVRPRSLCTLVEDVVAAHGAAVVVGRYEGEVVTVLVADDPALPDAIARATVARGWPRVPIGVSHVHDDLEVLALALREARTAAHAPPVAGVLVRDVASIGLDGILASVRQDLGAEAFVGQVLGPVLAHDADESGALVATLRAYLRHGCRPGPAAAELSIHRHTLSYRLQRIRDLTGRDPRDGGQLLTFALALELEAGG